MKKEELIIKGILLFLSLVMILGGILFKGTVVQAVESKTAETKAILSIDAGRKYVSLEQLKKIVDLAYERGYTGIELLLGNDGLRFLLDDMTVTTPTKTYASDAVKAGIYQGNQQYYDDPKGVALSQREMDLFFHYAAAKKLAVIPVINSPGHMDALLTAMEKVGIQQPAFKSSTRTIDLENEQAVSFTQSLLEKYMTYFANYCQWMNIGLDEYANDVQTDGGWAAIQKTGTYRKFVAYANELAESVKQQGMRPVAFNDGIYYNNDDSFGMFDSDIIIAYWTSGWSGYQVASAESLMTKGHQLLNTNDAWYWVIGRTTATDGYYHFQQALTGIQEQNFTKIVGTNKSLPILGSMQGIWADDPKASFDFDQLAKLMTAFSQKNAEYFRKID